MNACIHQENRGMISRISRDLVTTSTCALTQTDNDKLCKLCTATGRVKYERQNLLPIVEFFLPHNVLNQFLLLLRRTLCDR